MKKFFLTLIFLFIILILRANPLSSPTVSLSEIYFDDNGKWVIELQYTDAQQDRVPIDSIWIESKSGISKIRRFNITGSTGLIIVRNDSLLSPLTINSLNDSIRIIYNSGNYKLPDGSLVIYGNLINSTLDSPQKGQSIAGVPPYFPYINSYSIDNSPTIGMVNDTIGMCGTIKGHIYNRNNQLLSIVGGNFYNDAQTDFYISPKLDGSYSIRSFSKRYRLDRLTYYNTVHPQGFTAKISPIDISMQPNSIVNLDIHILDSLMVGLNEINIGEGSLIKIFPNPVNELTLNYEIGIPVISTHCYIDLVNLNGFKICQFSIIENQSKISLPSNIENGVYIINLYANNRKYSSSKVKISR